MLHVVQRKDAVTARHDLSGAIGLGVKSQLLEELTRLEEADTRLQVERGRVVIANGEARLAAAGAIGVTTLHRHGGIVETILEREVDAQIVVTGKHGASHQFAQDHIGSKVERVVRASNKPILIASRGAETPSVAVLAYDGSPAARQPAALWSTAPARRSVRTCRCMSWSSVPMTRHRQLLANTEAALPGQEVTTTLRSGKPEEVIAAVAGATPDALLMMGAYGHSPLRILIIGSTTTAMIRSVHVPILLVR